MTKCVLIIYNNQKSGRTLFPYTTGGSPSSARPIYPGIVVAYIVVGLFRLGNVELMLLFLSASWNHKLSGLAILMEGWGEHHDSYTEYAIEAGLASVELKRVL